MTTTKELIDWLNVESKLASGDGSPIAASRLRDAAKRLSELDAQVKQQINDYGRGMAVADLMPKPDCAWHKVGNTFDTACNARYRDGAYSAWKTCPNCGGAIKHL